jgi:DNA repair photolyase
MSVRLVQCRSALSRSRLPGLDWALNPYRGCGHACAYCYAQDVTRFEVGRPWGETIEVKVNLVQRLKRELESRVEGVYGIGTVTDPYQPIEKEYELTRGSLSLLRRSGARVSVLTKSDLVLRDVDLLRSWHDAEVGMSISCLDDSVARIVEPRAPPPNRRLRALAALASEGVSTYLMFAPVIPGLGDSDEELRDVVREAKEASVRSIMWDRFNPKPIASSRLKAALSERGIEPRSAASSSDAKRIRSVLGNEGHSQGIRIDDAF